MEFFKDTQHPAPNHVLSELMIDRDFHALILNAVADPIFVKDQQHRWILINDAFCSFLGLKRDELIGRSDYDFFPSQQADVFWETDRHVLNTGIVNENEESITDGYGVVHTILTRKSRYVSASGEVYLVGIIRDLTDRKIADERRNQLLSEQRVRSAIEQKGEQLQSVTHRLRAILETLPVGVFVLDAHGKVVETNSAVKTIWGGDAIGEYRGWSAKTGQRLWRDDWAGARALFHGETVVGDIVDILRFDGKCARIITSAVPLRNSMGRIDGAVVVAHDITELGHAETRLKESEATLKLAVDATGIGIFDYDRVERTIEFSPIAKKQFGLPMEEGMTYPAFLECIHPEDRDFVDQIARNALKKGCDERYRFECRVVGLGKRPEEVEVRWILAEWTVLLNAQGVPNRVIGATVDITQQKKYEDWLKSTKEDAESASRMKSEFLDIAAHELRTPLTPMTILIQFAQMQLKKGKPVSVDLLNKISSQVQRLTSLVDDLLNASRLERGGLNLHSEILDIKVVVEECVQDLRMRAPDRAVEFMAPSDPVWVNADPVRIHQVLGNFLENALKYTPPGSPIEVQVRRDESSAHVYVIDHGPGIPKEKQCDLFNRFYRVKTDNTLRHPGLGLGLFICRRIMELHHGTIGVESELGKGSTFYFTIPSKNT